MLLQLINVIEHLKIPGLAALIVAGVTTVIILAKSVKDFSYAGPQIIGVINKHYKLYVIISVARLAAWTFLISFYLSSIGGIIYLCLSYLFNIAPGIAGAIFFCSISLLSISIFQFCKHLLYSPGSIAVSSHYRMSHFYRLSEYLSPKIFKALLVPLIILLMLVFIACLDSFITENWSVLASIVVPSLLVTFIYFSSLLPGEPKPLSNGTSGSTSLPNIVMIGCDTLRTDRISATGYKRKTTPFIDSLIEKGTFFSNCYVPVARTAPSLISYFSGCWPHEHGVRDNFVEDDEATIKHKMLPEILRRAGYRTAAISDWAGSDLGKYNFGFDYLDAPEDQWNIKYLIRQGPKDIRLFLSLFSNNRFGKKFLPEIYYLAGTPLTSHIGRYSRNYISEFGEDDRPFFLNIFMATAHPPFGSEYPFYKTYTDPDYSGESKYIMSKLNDPLDIIRSQREPKEAFDLDQIIDLYDGCVRNFDHEVSRIVEYINASGLGENTIVIVYSDHGMEFFEHDTWGQGNSAIGDFSARVPLIIVDPRKKGAGNVSSIIRTIDFSPTILDLLGLEPEKSMQGTSVKKLIESTENDLNLIAYFETGIWLCPQPAAEKGHMSYPDILEILDIDNCEKGTLCIKDKYKDIVIKARDRMIREGDWKMVYLPMNDGAIYKLYNLENDPECKKDISIDHPAILARLKGKMNEWLLADGIDVAS